MAELIPLEYRIRVARAGWIKCWTTLLVATTVVAGAWLGQTYMWRRQQAADYARVALQYQESSLHLKHFSDLRSQREGLATRMKKIADLREDKVLLSLLTSVSSGIASTDALEYIHIEAHPVDKKPEDACYSVRIHGITANDTTHSQLLDRLTQIGKASPLPMVVPLGEKHVTPMLDGEVTSFDITCNQPLAKGG